jgi:hypothetical protein
VRHIRGRAGRSLQTRTAARKLLTGGGLEVTDFHYGDHATRFIHVFDGTDSKNRGLLACNLAENHGAFPNHRPTWAT